MAVLGESATLAFRAGELPQMLHEPGTPIELKRAGGGATARVEGTIAWAGAPRAGDLARWLALDPESNLPLTLHGRLRVNGEWRLEQTTLKLGRSELTFPAASRPSKITITTRSLSGHDGEKQERREDYELHHAQHHAGPAP